MEYTIKYSERKNIRVTIERDRSVVVTVPHGTATEVIKTAVRSRWMDIQRKIDHPQKYPMPQPIKEFVSGESILFLGRAYPLTVAANLAEGLSFKDQFYIAVQSQLQANELLRNWYITQAHQYLLPKIKQFAQRLGVQYNRIRITNLQYRWGSCTPQNNLHFNWRLIKAPMSVIEYIIVHELVHLLEPNHTPVFWNIVGVQLPHYEKAKDWLKLNGHHLEIDF